MIFMPEIIYTLLGASGQVGSTIVHRLLEKGKTVRLVSRHPDRVKSFISRGAIACIGDLNDLEFLRDAFAGAEAAFVLTPPDYKSEDYENSQLSTGKAIAASLQGSSVSQVVNLSAHHAQDAQAPGILHNLYRNEMELNRLSQISVLHLRPAYFMENLFAILPQIPGGIIGTQFSPYRLMPMIAVEDIGNYAAKQLLRLDFRGKQVVELLGQRDLSMADITRTLSFALGMHLHYRQFTAEQGRQSLLDSGHFSGSAADLIVEMNEALNGGALTQSPRTAENATPTSIEFFAGKFRTAYEKQSRISHSPSLNPLQL